MTSDAAGWATLNTRVRPATRRALEIVCHDGSTLQEHTDRALAAYLAAHYPEVVVAVGDTDAELKMAQEYLSRRQRG